MNKLSYIAFACFTLFLTSCISTKKELPAWAEIKPANTNKEIFFVYGPSDSRDSVKQGLYKEISEYFGVSVSSVDKFVKQTTSVNGDLNTAQSVESNVDVESRNKGLNSIEIREIWNDDKNSRWCILASIPVEAEKKIKKQIEIDIENERVARILEESFQYTKDSQLALNEIEQKILDTNRLILKIDQTINKISSISSHNEILKLAEEALLNSDESKLLIKDIKILTGNIKVYSKKNSILKNQLGDNEVASVELDLQIEENFDLLNKAEMKGTNLERFTMNLDQNTEELQRLKLKSEMELLGNKEEQELYLKNLLETINSNYLRIKEIKNETEFLNKESEDFLVGLKQLEVNKSLNVNEIKLKISELLPKLEKNFQIAQSNLKNSYELKKEINSLSNNATNSALISEKEKNNLREISNGIDSPISWTEIYKDKISVLVTKAKKIVDDLNVEDLLSSRINSFVTNLLTKTSTTKGLDLTIGEFTIEETKISSDFSSYFKNQLLSSLSKYNDINIVDYESVTEFLTNKNISPNQLYNGAESTESLVDNILYGNYWIYGDQVEIRITLKNIINNRVTYSDTLKMPIKSIPDISLKPDNYDLIVSLNNKLKGNTNEVGFDVWPDKGDGSLYKDGENMIINIITPIAGYVKIYHISADNDLTLVFPNKFDPNNRLEAGKKYTIGDRSYPFTFKLGKPYGTESLKAIFSLKQFPDLEGTSYNDGFLYTGVRGINIEKRINEDLVIDSVISTSYYTITNK